MSRSTEDKNEKDSTLNIPGILADFFLKKIEMGSPSDDSDYKHKKKKSKHKKEKRKTSKHRRSSKSSSSSGDRSLSRKKEVDDVSSSEESGMKRLKKIKDLKLGSKSSIVLQPISVNPSGGTEKTDQPNNTNNLVFYGPSLELLLSGVDSSTSKPEPVCVPNPESDKDDNLKCDKSKMEKLDVNRVSESYDVKKIPLSSVSNVVNDIKDVSVTEEKFILSNAKDTSVSDVLSISKDASVSDILTNNSTDALADSKSALVPNTSTTITKDASLSNALVIENNPPFIELNKPHNDINSNLEGKESKQRMGQKEKESLTDTEKNKNEIVSCPDKIKQGCPNESAKEQVDPVIDKSKVKCINDSAHKQDSTEKSKKRHEGKRNHSRSRSKSKTRSIKKKGNYRKRESRSRSSSRDSCSRYKQRHSRSVSREKSKSHRKRSHSRSRSRSRFSKQRKHSHSRSPVHRSRRSRSLSDSRNRRHSRSKSRRRSRSTHRIHSRSRSRHRSRRSKSRSRSRRQSNSRHRSRSSSRSRTRRRSMSRSRSRSKARKTSETKESRQSRSRSKSKDRKSKKIDQAKVLETARRNVLKMMKSGTLPDGLPVDNLQKEQLISIQAGGKSVQELTDFCQRLSQKENDPVDSDDSKDNETGDDENGFIHHPFKIKEPGMIKLNIRNAVQLPIKTHSQKIAETARLSSQFPVSSGNQHKRKELEWIPVIPGAAKTAETKTSEKKASFHTNTTTTVALIENPTTSVPPPPPIPASYPVSSTSAEVPQVNAVTTVSPLLPPPMPPELILPPPPPPPPPPPSAPPPPLIPTRLPLLPAPPSQHAMYMIADNQQMMPAVSQPAPTPSSSQSVFKPRRKIDISAIVTRRFQALTKLKQNENDPDALTTLQEAQQDIQEWVESQQVPGMFTGSTDAKVLSAAELCGPKYYSYKFKKDFFTHAPPVSGGKGMSLLKKMGWNPGEGLGKNKEGSLEPLVLDIKMDKKGLVSEGENKKGASSFTKELQGKHPVSALMELCSKRKWKPPLYTCIMDIGPPHKKQYCFKVEVNGVEYQPLNPCANKKVAKADSAILCLQSLNVFPQNAPS